MDRGCGIRFDIPGLDAAYDPEIPLPYFRRNIKRVQSSVAGEHAEVTSRSLIERRGSGWGERRLVVAASNVAVAAFVGSRTATPRPMLRIGLRSLRMVRSQL